MKKLWAAAMVLCGLALGQPALAQPHHVELHGIMNLPGRHVAFLLVDREKLVLDPGERFKVGRAQAPAEILEIDVTNEIVRTRIEGVDYTNSLPKPDRPAAAQSWIHLDDADFITAVEMYGHLAGKTMLIHPSFVHARFSCEGSWTTAAPSKNDYRDCFAKGFTHLMIASLDDGDSFIQIIPGEMANGVTLGAKDLPKSDADPIQAGMVDFGGVEINQVMDIYAKLLNRPRKEGDFFNGPRAGIYLKTTCQLSKSQIIYALETLFRWNGANIVLNDDNTFSVTKSPPPVK